MPGRCGPSKPSSPPNAAGVSNLIALGASAVVPAIGVAVQLATRRRLDGVGGLVLASVVAAIAASLITHSPRFLLAKDGLITAVWGLWFLASTRSRRPAAFVMARPVSNVYYHRAGLYRILGARWLRPAQARSAGENASGGAAAAGR